MTEIGTFDAKNKLSALLDRVEQGQEVVITRRGRPVAKLVPVSKQRRSKAAADAIRRIRERAQALKLSPSEVTELIRRRRDGLA